MKLAEYGDATMDLALPWSPTSTANICAATTTQRYLHPDPHKITAAGAALSAHLNVLRAPRTLPATTVLTR